MGSVHALATITIDTLYTCFHVGRLHDVVNIGILSKLPTHGRTYIS